SAAPVRPALLAGARYRFLALDPLALELGVEALLRPKPASFEVEDGAAYEDAPVALRVGLGVSFGIP
ncbi:MAG: hypothetical protein KC933_41475, partial [Myxococcales bacterium]|nr:hypothetical protein [Myxococcales bacterium]